MTSGEFSLAATTNDLSREPDARETADFIEFRMDSAKNPITQLSEYDGELPIIATNRPKWCGGEADDSGRLDHLFAAARFDAVEMVDIEVETVREKQWILDEFRDNDVLILTSFHDFEETPDQKTLDAIIADCANYGDIAKVATFAEDYADTERMLKAINTATSNGICVVGLSMGEIGSHTRVVGPLYGATLGYAPLESDTSEYAPGQIPLSKLDSLIESARESRESAGGIDGIAEKFSTPFVRQTD
jgi:3-dehydroquinate dehydratase-1